MTDDYSRLGVRLRRSITADTPGQLLPLQWFLILTGTGFGLMLLRFVHGAAKVKLFEVVLVAR